MPKILVKNVVPNNTGIINTVSKNTGVINVISKNKTSGVSGGETDFLATELFAGMSMGLLLAITYPTYEILNVN